MAVVEMAAAAASVIETRAEGYALADAQVLRKYSHVCASARLVHAPRLLGARGRRAAIRRGLHRAFLHPLLHLAPPGEIQIGPCLSMVAVLVDCALSTPRLPDRTLVKLLMNIRATELVSLFAMSDVATRAKSIFILLVRRQRIRHLCVAW
eukprot:831918-Pleurochrysis_carterae.AAC.1